MQEFLYSIDLSIFYFINDTISNSLFDKFFPYITNVKHWYLVYIILWSILFFRGGKYGKLSAVGVIFLIVASDQLNSHFLKDIFERLRPCNALDDVNLLVRCSKTYSFPSSHAVNNFAIAFYFYKLFPRLKWIFIISAFLVAFSRPYVGVHYPSDIFIGSLIGAGIGLLFAIIVLKIHELMSKKTNN